MNEFLLVNFPEPRALLINGFEQGRTNTIVRLEPGTYDVSLAGPRSFTPDAQRITLRFTAITNPAELTFHLLPPSALILAVTEGRA